MSDGARRDALERAATLLAHDERQHAHAVVPPIFQNSLFTFDSYAEMRSTFAGEPALGGAPRDVYTRVQNPTVRAFETKLAALEGADAAVGFASGMAAVSAAVLSVVEAGDRAVVSRHVYPDAFRFFELVAKAAGVTTDYVDATDLAAVEAALPGARLCYLESPTSWTFEVLDLPAIATLARARGVTTVIDNSWATPLFQRPLELGIDLSVHSASKYLGGHSDVVAGVVAGSTARIAAIRARVLPYLGAKLAPFEAWLLLRGLRTLVPRVRETERSALELARRLADHGDVSRVLHPGLAGTLPPHLHGTTGLFAFEPRENVDIERFCDALTLFRLGVSWGGHESLVCPAAVTHAQAAEPNHARFFGVPERLVRLNVGLESTDDLWSDLDRALREGGA